MPTRPLDSTPELKSRPLAAVPKNLFAAVLKTSARLADQYRPATADEKGPALKDYKTIEEPGTLAADTVRFVTQDGQHVMVSKATNPTLYKQVVEDRAALQGISKSLAEGYELGTAETAVPDTLGSYRFIGPPDQEGPIKR
jgi:hypothetical protein